MVPIVFLSVTVSRRDPAGLAQQGPPQVVARLRGEHDLSTVAELSAALAQAMALGDTDLVVDLSRVELMTAATIGVLRRAQDLLALRSRSLVVRAPSARARRVLEVSDLQLDRSERHRPIQLAMLDRAPKIVLVESTPIELAS
jgi:anti-anti-sigma factor